jgi:hypothetical protein
VIQETKPVTKDAGQFPLVPFQGAEADRDGCAGADPFTDDRAVLEHKCRVVPFPVCDYGVDFADSLAVVAELERRCPAGEPARRRERFPVQLAVPQGFKTVRDSESVGLAARSEPAVSERGR